jgi:hypothetical protein
MTSQNCRGRSFLRGSSFVLPPGNPVRKLRQIAHKKAPKPAKSTEMRIAGVTPVSPAPAHASRSCAACRQSALGRRRFEVARGFLEYFKLRLFVSHHRSIALGTRRVQARAQQVRVTVAREAATGRHAGSPAFP